MKTTFVTGLFDLTKYETATHRTVSDYLHYGKYVCSLDQDLVIFAEPELVPIIQEARSSRAKHTVTVGLTLKDLDCYGYIDAIRRYSPPPPTKDTPHYTIIGWAKFELLLRALALNPFRGCSHIGWIDFGLAHVARRPDDNPFALHPGRVRIPTLQFFDSTDVQIPECWRHPQHFIAAGFFSGPTKLIRCVAQLFLHRAQAALQYGFSPLEEHILPTLMVEHDDLFSRSYTQYVNILRNYCGPRTGFPHLLAQIQRANRKRKWNAACEMSEDIIKAHDGADSLPFDLFEALLTEYFIGAFYRDAPDQTVATQIAHRYLTLISENKTFASAYQAHADLIKSNFAFLKHTVKLP